MKNLISKEEKDQIDLICNAYYIKNYYINSDGSIDVDGEVDLTNINLTELPIKFNKVSGDFLCGCNKLTSLNGSPKIVGGSFSCYMNELTSLESAPTKVDGDFYCYLNKLTSLESAPTKVDGDFYCDSNRLSTLEGAPHTLSGNLICTYNYLTSTYSGDIDIEVGGDFHFNNNHLPLLLQDNAEHIKLILKYQRYFEIWNVDLSLNEENFQELMNDIKDGLE